MNLMDKIFREDLTEKTGDRIICWVGHLFFLIMIIGCVVYAPERMLVCDAGYYTFHVLNTETVFILHDRYINYLMQMPTIWAIKLGASLRASLTLYSATGFLWFYLIFIFIFHVLKSRGGALLLIFSLCLTMRYKHYAGHTEITVAIAFACLLFAWMATDKSKLEWFKSWMHWVGMALICFILYFIHPIIVVPLCMLIGADIILNNRWKDRNNWLSLGIVLLAFGTKFYFEVFNNEYEAGRVSTLSSVFDIIEKPSAFPVIFGLVGEYFTEQYFLVFPLFLIAIFLIIKNKGWFGGAYLFFSTVLLLCLIIVTFSDLRSRLLFIMDGYMGMLGMLFGITLMTGFAVYSKKMWPYMLFTILIAVSVFQIERKHQFFENRLTSMDKTFELNEQHPKLFVELKDFDWDKMWYPYEVPLESLIWTSLKGKENGKTIYVDANDYRTKVKVDSIDGFYMFGAPGPLNDKFFQLPEVKYKLTDKVGWKE